MCAVCLRPVHPFPLQAVSAFGCAPVATSALLTWCLCAELHPASAAASSWLAVLGTLGDLGEEGLGVFTGAVGGGDDGGAAAAAIASGAGAGQGGGQSSASAGRGGGASDGGSSSGGGSASDGVEQQAGGAAASGTTAAAGAALPELDWVFRAGRKTHFKDAVALLNAGERGGGSRRPPIKLHQTRIGRNNVVAISCLDSTHIANIDAC